jgi:PAS domain S-box-containing protein
MPVVAGAGLPRLAFQDPHGELPAADRIHQGASVKLQNKFMALLLPAGLAAAGMIVILIRKSVHSVILDGLEKNVTSVAAASAHGAAPAFESGREERLLSQLLALQSREGALYAAALDARGKVLAHTTISKKGTVEGDAFARAALASDQLVVHILHPPDGPVLEVSAPVFAAPAPEEAVMLSSQARARTRLGLLKVGVPLAPILATESRIIRDILLIIAATGLLVAGIVLLLVRKILKPVSGLLAGISRISQGSYGVEVPILSSDEIGALALSFNRMSAELARTTVSRNYMEGILANMIDLLVVTDPAGTIETMNPALLATLSYSSEEMVGRPVTDLFRDGLGALRGRELPAVVAEGGVRDLAVALRTKSGAEIPVLFSASVLNDRNGKLRGYIGVAKDMTEHKRAEGALLAAKAAAEASSKELEAFSYSVAHDLRAPLRAVDGFSQVVLDRYGDRLDEQGRDYLQRVRGGSRRMGQLIDDLLNLSRITRAKMRVESVDLTSLAREIAEELQRTQPGRKAEFVIAEGLTAAGDPDLLRVVLVNLLGNAWKYTGKKPAARIEFGAESREGAAAYFVRDDGAGFDMAFSNKLFMPFNRLHSASEFEGTGIGLATVQRVIERHGGRVWGEGEVEKGATFRFTLWEARGHGGDIHPARRG